MDAYSETMARLAVQLAQELLAAEDEAHEDHHRDMLHQTAPGVAAVRTL
jgi:hypothetical protein